MGCKETHILTSQQYHYVSALRFHLFFIGSLWRKLCEKSDFCHNFSSPIASPSVLYVNGLAKLMTWRLLDVVSTVLDWFNARFARQCNNAEYHHYSVHWTFDIFRMGLLNKNMMNWILGWCMSARIYHRPPCDKGCEHSKNFEKLTMRELREPPPPLNGKSPTIFSIKWSKKG